MPVRGRLPPNHEHDVIIADVHAYHQGRLIHISNGNATIETQAILNQGLLRIFPLHTETDGPYELQGRFKEHNQSQIVVALQENS